MYLQTLPTELLSCIATNLLPSVQDVNSLAKTSKIMYAIINPILYHHQILHQDSSALLWAAKHGKPDPCNRLLQEGANPNTQDAEHRTPLSWAAGNGHKQVSSILLCSEKIDPNAPDVRLQTPLVWAAGNGEPSPSTAWNSPRLTTEPVHSKAGVDTDASIQSRNGPLLAAAWQGHADIVKLLLSIPTVDPNQLPGLGDRPLLTAVSYGHTDVVEVLLANEKVDPSLPGKYGVTALGRAAQQGRTHIMQLLLAKGVEPDVKDSEGSTPLMSAAVRGHVEVVNLLLSTGRVQADFDLTKRNISCAFAPSKLSEDIVRVLGDYKSRHRGGSL
ncbi:hypothetical protein N7445_007792 [Penicillium cf. griseofulvum]|nr:hypothetical protein N7445_007792 [Penicillium cf. griseofulvum]